MWVHGRWRIRPPAHMQGQHMLRNNTGASTIRYIFPRKCTRSASAPAASQRDLACALRPRSDYQQTDVLLWRGQQKQHTYRYIQLLVSRLGLPLNHSGAKVIQPSVAVNHVSASYSHNNAKCLISTVPGSGPHPASPIAYRLFPALQMPLPI
jgi:hypothetical protein